MPTSARFHDWEDRLADYLTATADKPFLFGEFDCALDVAGAALAMTGDDFGAPFRKKYDTAKGAAEALRAYGAGTLQRTLTAAFGAPFHPAFAQRGDAVMAGGNVGICLGAQAAFVTDAGRVLLPRSEWAKAWGVGR